MADIEVEIRGLDQAYRRLGVDVLQVLEQPIERAMTRVTMRMKIYPPKREGQTYERTDKLGQRWTQRIMRTSTSITGEVGNNTEYGPWVQSEQFQAWMHRRRWPTDEEALREVQPGFVRDAERAVVGALEED